MKNLAPLIAVDNNGVLITTGKASVKIEGKKYEGEGSIRLLFYPQPRLKLSGTFLIQTPVGLDSTLEFSIDGQVFDGTMISCSITNAHCEIGYIQEPIILGESDGSLKRVFFHLFNFLEFNGKRCTNEKAGSVSHLINHLDLEWQGWKIEIKSHLKTNDNFKKLKAGGGYEITHIGEITRSDGSLFTSEEAKERILELGIFLSFAKGTFCEPVGVIGFDSEERRIWEYWTSPREPWAQPLSWFEREGSQLNTLYPVFMEKWNSRWKETFQEVLSLRLNANNDRIFLESRITLTQMAFERLAYEYLVIDQKLFTWKQFNKRSAARNFRKLFSELRIPLELPDHYEGLTTLLEELKTEENLKQAKPNSEPRPIDSCSVLTEVRNYLAHPQPEQSDSVRSSYFEAWNLGNWYLELCILAICKYPGEYSNRLNSGRYRGMRENVPWELLRNKLGKAAIVSNMVRLCFRKIIEIQRIAFNKYCIDIFKHILRKGGCNSIRLSHRQFLELDKS